MDLKPSQITDIGLAKSEDATVIEKSEILVAEDVITIPAHVERAGFRYSFDKDPLIVGDVIEIPIIKNGKEIDRLKFAIENSPKEGNEIRPLFTCDVVEMTAFSRL